MTGQRCVFARNSRLPSRRPSEFPEEMAQRVLLKILTGTQKEKVAKF